jgi:hypothetical protein
MASSDSAHSFDDSSCSDDPDKSCTTPNSLLQLDYAYATDLESVVDGTTQKKIDEEDGQSYGSEFHRLAQLSKRQHLPSVSQVKWSETLVAGSDSDGVDLHSSNLAKFERVRIKQVKCQ